MGNIAFLIIIVLTFLKNNAFAKEAKIIPEIKELENGILIKKIGHLLQGGGSSHALIKFNISRLALESELSCSGVEMVAGFVENGVNTSGRNGKSKSRV